MKITKKWLIEKQACSGIIDWWSKSKISDPKKIIKKLMGYEEYSWCNWLLINLFNRKQCLKYVIFSSEQVLPIFEAKFPNDHRPRLAIQAVKNVLENDTKKNRAKARTLSNATANIASSDVANAVSYASHIAAYIANTVSSAANAVMYAISATEEKPKMQLKILNYGISLLKGGLK